MSERQLVSALCSTCTCHYVSSCECLRLGSGVENKGGIKGDIVLSKSASDGNVVSSESEITIMSEQSLVSSESVEMSLSDSICKSEESFVASVSIVVLFLSEGEENRGGVKSGFASMSGNRGGASSRSVVDCIFCTVNGC